MNKIIIAVVITTIVAGGIGFFSGMEYKAYQVRTAIQQAFQPSKAISNQDQTSPQPTTSISSNSILAQAKQEDDKIIVKNIGDDVTLATMKIKINKVTETQTLSSGYSNPEVAPSDSKFAVLDVTVTNLTNSKFNFNPSEGFIIIDNKKREFTPKNSIGSIDNYLDERELQPSISENGVIVYQLPSDSTRYSFNVLKGGVKELYQINLK